MQSAAARSSCVTAERCSRRTREAFKTVSSAAMRSLLLHLSQRVLILFSLVMCLLVLSQVCVVQRVQVDKVRC